MLKFHLFLGISGKDAVLVPPKLSSELELRSTFLGQFWRHSDGIFPRIPRQKVEFYPILNQATPQAWLTLKIRLLNSETVVVKIDFEKFMCMLRSPKTFYLNFPPPELWAK